MGKQYRSPCVSGDNMKKDNVNGSLDGKKCFSPCNKKSELSQCEIHIPGLSPGSRLLPRPIQSSGPVIWNLMLKISITF